MNILLDTNVLSEVMRSRPDQIVVTWLASQQRPNVFVSAITQAEMILGARLLPDGKRRHTLEQALGAMFNLRFSNRVLAFDVNCANHYADIVATRQKRGKPIGPLDAQIAAIAQARQLSVATRNTRDFEGCGITLINPWLSD
jgi:toxin FitB